MKGRRRIRSNFKDEKGNDCFAVSLGSFDSSKEIQEAIIYKEDWEFLHKLGLSVAWRLSNGYVVAPNPRCPGSFVNVARVLLGAGEKTSVRYLNGDARDLRIENLALESGHGMRTDRNLVAPKPARMVR